MRKGQERKALCEGRIIHADDIWLSKDVVANSIIEMHGQLSIPVTMALLRDAIFSLEAEQAKALKFAATISRLQKKIDRLELSESTRRQFEDECG